MTRQLTAFGVFVIALALLTGAVVAAPQLLPGDVVPSHYDLAIKPDATALTYNGVVSVAVDVKRATADIVLNAEGLAFDKIAIDGRLPGTAAVDEKLGRVTLHFASPLSAGGHTLDIAYHGRLRRETLGFFAMDYATAGGPQRTLGTNLEPAFARRLLPCWDEPARKASFTITVDVPRNKMAISNMPVASVSDLDRGLKRVRFAMTPEMSTYLLFLGIGDFERVHGDSDGVDVGIVVKRGDTAKAAYALDEARKLLHFYDGYFGVHFPLPKLDLIAAPGDIDGDSMENWGAIFYSQSSLLFDSAKSTARDRQSVFLVVSHEMSHQWFGDLVTMKWWDNLWLNEGFARWMQTFAADALHPEWQTGLQAQSIFESGKQQDALPSTHPVLEAVTTADQAYQAFDAITYNKGAAIVTMLNAYIGQDAFREGLRRYMRAHAFGNTVDTDLWRVMQMVTGKPILDIERDFTRSAGLPLVEVTTTPAGLHLGESRFFADSASAPAHQAQRWMLPLPVGAPGGNAMMILLNGSRDVAIRPPALVNMGQTSYARVHYPQAAFEALLPLIRSLRPADQIGLMNDSFALGSAGIGSGENALAVMQRIPADGDPIVWKRAIAVLTSIDRHYADRPDQVSFRAWARNLLDAVARSIGLAPRAREGANVTILRDALIEALGLFGDRPVIAHARQLVDSGAGTAEEQRTALNVAAAQADAVTFAKLLGRARKTRDPLDRERVYEALGGVQDLGLASRMIEVSLSSEVPAGSNVSILIPLAQNHPDLVWRKAVPLLKSPAAAIPKNVQWEIVAAVGELSADQARIGEVRDYEAKNVPPEARKPFAGVPAAIHQNQRIAARMLPEIDRFIAANGTRLLAR